MEKLFPRGTKVENGLFIKSSCEIIPARKSIDCLEIRKNSFTRQIAAMKLWTFSIKVLFTSFRILSDKKLNH